MLKVQIGTLEFEVETHARTTSVKVTQRVRGEYVDVASGTQTDETKAALKAILAYIS
jgi:hypothetical protein